MEADLVVMNGEGSLHHSRPVIDKILRLAEARRAAGRPTALINTSWFQNTSEFTRRLEAFAIVSARDPRSAEEIARHLSGALIVPDLAIRHALTHRCSGTGGKSFMVSDSTLPTMTCRLRNLAARRGWEYLPVLARPVHHRPGAKARKIERRVRLARLLGPLAHWVVSARYHAHLVGEAETHDYLDRLAASAGILTGRFHTVCFAIGLQIPFVAIASNTPKIESLLSDVGLDPNLRMIRPDHLDTLEEIPPFSDQEKAALHAFARRAEGAYSNLFASLRGLVPALG